MDIMIVMPYEESCEIDGIIKFLSEYDMASKTTRECIKDFKTICSQAKIVCSKRYHRCTT